uniref:ATP synthase complex subunit 8 n=2 Tax=Labridae TaxID=8247 RepID=A0A411GXV7_9LABR|nr:ATP synthase F0 subunit 8 [Halichoeres nigrescens]YP_009861691.1 ATP synthase F0 subunit 8 [Thalassoma lunare]QBB10831.1 ATP synthase F0 subunit 8 [Halichoeres nigrescens]QKD75029.1 ATP synthase F0 subunit 8 [Thalassoma lunare]
MPQLNPSPWLAIFLFSWLVFLTVIPPKVLAYTFMNEPTSQSMEAPRTTSWAWPWH